MRTILKLAVLALLIPAVAGAQDYRQTVTAQLDQVAKLVSDSGYSASPSSMPRDQIIGTLNDRGASTIEMTFEAAHEYFIVGSCDEDCSDLDLVVYTFGDSNAIARDILDDDHPVLRFSVPRTGHYMMSVQMAKCSEASCFYGVRVYRKPLATSR